MPHLARLAHLNLANQEKRSSFVVVHRRMLVCQTTVELECQYASVTILCIVLFTWYASMPQKKSSTQHMPAA